MPDDTDALKAELAKPRRATAPSSVPAKDFLSWGFTPLNLACSGRPNGGIAKGTYCLMPGDSGAGKTWLCKTLMAEACLNPRFAAYRLYYDDAENGSLMNLVDCFGQRLADRIEAPPAFGDLGREPSRLVEDFYYRLDDLVKAGDPFIYVLDSMDALDSKEDREKFADKKKAHQKNKGVTGSYGTGKAKVNSTHLRPVAQALRRSGSILIIITQTRQNIGFGAQFVPKTRGGGDALNFYAHLTMWLSVAGKIKRPIKGKDREVGQFTKVQISKNRFSGFKPAVTLPIYHTFGIDDVRGCIDYLVKEGHWKGGKADGSDALVKAREFGLEGKPEGLAREIEEAGRTRELVDLVKEVWAEVREKSMLAGRQKRYT